MFKIVAKWLDTKTNKTYNIEHNFKERFENFTDAAEYAANQTFHSGSYVRYFLIIDENKNQYEQPFPS